MYSDPTHSTKAKSRISTERKVSLVTEKPLQTALKHRSSRHSWWHNQLVGLSKGPTQPIHFSSFNKTFSSVRVVWLIGSILTFCFLGMIFSTVYPENIANILFYQSYLPVVLLFFIATAALGKAVFVHTRRAVMLALLCSLLLFLKFQSVVIDWLVFIILLATFSVIDLIISLVFRK